MFGYRLRAGYVGEMWVELDWCCGPEPSDRESLLISLLCILHGRDADSAFDGLPSHSNIKPYFKDQDFKNKIDALLETATEQNNMNFKFKTKANVS